MEFAKKKDKLWIAWIHNYYLKGRKLWEVQVKQASWIVKKIIQAGQWLTEVELQVEETLEASTFSIKAVYKQLRGDFLKVPWRRIVCNNQD